MQRRDVGIPAERGCRPALPAWAGMAALFVALLAPGLLPIPSASAAEPSQDTVRAGQIQVQAGDALAAGRVDEALKLAERAVALDAGTNTWLAQQVRVEALERLGRLEEAMSRLQDYMEIEALFAEHRAWGEAARERIAAALSDRRHGAELLRGRRTGGGVLLGAALAPIAIGIGSLANFGSHGGDVALWGGWADFGAAMLGAGAATATAGGILLGSGLERPWGQRGGGAAPGSAGGGR